MIYANMFYLLNNIITQLSNPNTYAKNVNNNLENRYISRLGHI